MSDEQRRPPYAPVKGLRDFFDRVTQNKQPSRVDRPYLASLGVAASNEQHVVAALKFLGLLDQEGRPTPRFNDLYLKSADRERSLQLLLRRSYPGLFAHGIDLQTAGRAELHDFFVRRYGMQGQMARKAAAVFVFLASLAGLTLSPALAQEARASSLSGTTRRARPRPAAPATAREPAPYTAPSPSSDLGILAPGGWPVALLVTAEMSEDDIFELLRRVRRALAREAAHAEGG